MFKCSCDKCGQTLHEDVFGTIKEYDKEVSFLIKEDKLSLDVSPRYIVFKCPVCKSSLKISIDDLINPHLKFILEKLSEYRMKKCMDSVAFTEFMENFSADHGIDYCGYCCGFLDGDGYCYNDVINKCIVRRNIIEKKL